MHPRKTVFTTGEVAKICSVAPRTVSKWFDAGLVRGYRIPGSKDRRIPVEQLIRFMHAHGIPLNGLSSACTRVLVLDSDEALGQRIDAALVDGDGYEVKTATSALEAGAIIHQFKPDVILVDVTLPDVIPNVTTRFVRSLDERPTICLIGMAPGLTEAEGQALMQQGFDGYLSKPFHVSSLVQLIEKKTPLPVDSDIP